MALRAELEESIVPYKDITTKKPPFSGAELAVIAAICTGLQPKTKRDILRWILQKFAYYRERAINSYVDASVEEYESEDSQYVFCEVEHFFDAFKSFDVPIQPQSIVVDQDVPNLYIAEPAASRIFLRRYLEPERKGTFRFLDLPAELRNTIYEMLFTFPQPGIAAVHELADGMSWPCLKLLRSNVEDCNARNEDPSAISGHTGVFAPRMSEVLALLCVCKQINQEALPYFYRTNRSYFESAAAFSTVFSALATSRIVHLADLQLDLRVNFDDALYEFGSAAEALKAVKTLSRLKLSMSDDDAWLKMLPSERRALCGTTRKAFVGFHQIPGFGNLAKVAARAEELIITGDCPEFRAFMDKEMKRIQATPEDMPQSKRKRQSVKSDAKVKVKEELNTPRGKRTRTRMVAVVDES